VLLSVIISNARGKSYAGTKSWSSNCLIRLFFVLQQASEPAKQLIGHFKLPAFVSNLKQREDYGKLKSSLATIVFGVEEPERVIVEDNGYITFQDMAKEDNEETKS